ncbi:InlB B-repeat-containing protein [Alkalibacillus almallahensis]|uniref:InlB B-repeat-containing protein n=1 Tax=Alkalibacillus almallahensis TaxID=1379154 RepID=UPI001423ED5D
MLRLIIAIHIMLVMLLIGCSEQEYEVSVDIQPEDAGEVTGTGLYESGEEAVVSLQPEDGYEFSGWSKEGETVSSDLEYRFEVDQDVQLQASLEETVEDIVVEHTLDKGTAMSLETVEKIEFKDENVSIDKSQLQQSLDQVWESSNAPDLWDNQFAEVIEEHPDVNQLFIRHEGLSPNEDKIAVSVFTSGDVFSYTVVGYVDLETEDIQFTNVTNQVVSAREGIIWSPDENYYVYTTVNEAPSNQQAFVDSIDDGNNIVTADFSTISEAELLNVNTIEWEDDQESIYIDAIGQVGNRIEARLSLESGEFEQE